MAFLAHGWAAREGDEGSDEGMPTLAVEAEGKEAIHGAPVMETTKRTTETAVDVTEEPTLQPTTMTPNATSLPTSLPTKDTIVTNATTTTTSKPISFCNVTLEGATNSFKSQNYPQDYPNNLTQTWCIDTLDDCPLSMTFRDIEVQQDNNCTLDNITVYDGPTASSRELASICANSTITSTSNKVYVVFRTDADTVKHGFDALYEAAKCHFHNLIVTKAPGILELNTTRVTSQWLLAAEAGRVQLTFELFELDDCCNCDYLEVYDGSDTSSGLMGKFCGIMEVFRGLWPDRNLSVSQRTVSRAVRTVSAAIVQALGHEWISFPSDAAERAASKGSFTRRDPRFSGAIGAVDGTLISILGPPDSDSGTTKDVYWCRKQHTRSTSWWFATAICGFYISTHLLPGGSHDAFGWRRSSLRHELATGNLLLADEFILGDSGYPLEPWLIVPVPGSHPRDSPAARFNIAHASLRSIVERCFGVLKQRFRCLHKHHSLYYRPQIAGTIVAACAVLHNICIATTEPHPDPADETDDDNDGYIADNQPTTSSSDFFARGRAKRDALLNKFSGTGHRRQ
ncbi:cubilin-like isoform X2 [Ornithodoros turicata]|uniref:cubilin-like isoform X2 n=1 Tax=Ornithodoros turicata TaxID=34597 RepID=UPI003139C87A